MRTKSIVTDKGDIIRVRSTGSRGLWRFSETVRRTVWVDSRGNSWCKYLGLWHLGIEDGGAFKVTQTAADDG